MEALLILGGVVVLAVSWAWLVFASLGLGPGPLMLATLVPVVTPLVRGRGYPVLPRVLMVLALVSFTAGWRCSIAMSPSASSDCSVATGLLLRPTWPSAER